MVVDQGGHVHPHSSADAGVEGNSGQPYSRAQQAVLEEGLRHGVNKAGTHHAALSALRRFMVQDAVATEQEDTCKHGAPPQQFSVR